MRMYDVIEKKRDGKELTREEIHFFIEGYTTQQIPDYQVSALLMAIYYQGMTESELTHLTMEMVRSGEQIDLSGIDGFKVDKHSTGGVGDTTTLIITPIVASLGVPVAKMSGRGLGHTGGTLDKLEAIPNFNFELTQEEFIDRVNTHKLSVIGQTGNIVPADKLLYSLRDVTATVNSIPLIASSIMSKKIASGANGIVLDVKAGSGAFMKNIEQARALAEAMVHIGTSVGIRTRAIISSMNQPLGNAIGNALEIKEAVETLQGKGPQDLTELCIELSTQMVLLARPNETYEHTRKKVTEQISNHQALEKFKELIDHQYGESNVVDNLLLLPQAAYTFEVPSRKAGYIEHIEADEIGTAAMLLGAGRATKDAEIDLAVGIVLHKKVGDFVEKGESLATIFANDQDVTTSIEKMQTNISIQNSKPEVEPLIYDTIQ